MLIKQGASLRGDKKIYRDIDLLEKSRIEITEFHKRTEEFRKFIILALFLLLISFILKITYLKQVI